MKDEIRVAIIGLDTSHSVEFPRRMQSPDVADEQKVEGMRAVSCLRFMTPFTDEDVLNERQAQLESWGINVTEDFDEAVSDCDAIMLEINDPAYHLEYFKKCVDLGKPIFLDKPLADNYENGKKIFDLAKENDVRVISSSSLRFSPKLTEACDVVSNPNQAYCYGPLGIPPVGSGIVWYGVHCFEMIQRAMGRGAISVDTRRDDAGAVVLIEYPDNRRAIAELTVGDYAYGGSLRSKDGNSSFIVDSSTIYRDQLREIYKFFTTGEASLSLDDALEIINMLDCAAQSYELGRPVELY